MLHPGYQKLRSGAGLCPEGCTVWAIQHCVLPGCTMSLGLSLLASPRLPAYADGALTIEDFASMVYLKGFTRHEKCSYILCTIAPFPPVICLCLVGG